MVGKNNFILLGITSDFYWYHIRLYLVPHQTSTGITSVFYCCYHIRLLVVPHQSSTGTTSDFQWYHISLLLVPHQSSTGTTSDFYWYHIRLLLVPHQSTGTTSDFYWYQISLLLVPYHALHSALVCSCFFVYFHRFTSIYIYTYYKWVIINYGMGVQIKWEQISNTFWWGVDTNVKKCQQWVKHVTIIR